MIETDRWRFIKAKHYTDVPKDRPRRVRLIVIHVMDADEKGSTAEAVGNYFATTEREASAHVGVDIDSVVQYVPDSDVAYAAPGCNNDGIQVELAGFSSQTREQWDDEYSRKVLDKAADVVAQYCLKYTIPDRHLTNTELLRGDKGIIGHYQATQAYPGPGRTHTDPGPNFPWERFMASVHRHYLERREKALR